MRPTMFRGRDFIGVDVRSSSEKMSITRPYPFIAAEEDCIFANLRKRLDYSEFAKLQSFALASWRDAGQAEDLDDK